MNSEGCGATKASKRRFLGVSIYLKNESSEPIFQLQKSCLFVSFLLKRCLVGRLKLDSDSSSQNSPTFEKRVKYWRTITNLIKKNIQRAGKTPLHYVGIFGSAFRNFSGLHFAIWFVQENSWMIAGNQNSIVFQNSIYHVQRTPTSKVSFWRGILRILT